MPPSVVRRLPASLMTLSLAAGLLAVGCAGVGGQSTARESRDLSLAQLTSQLVRVEVFNGEITVRPGPAGGVSATVTVTGVGATRQEAEADRANIATTLQETGGAVVLQAVYQPDPANPRNRGASAVVSVPAGSSLELTTSNGKVGIAGITGAVTVRTSNGEVTVDGAVAGVDAETSNGAISVTGSRGPLGLVSSNARIRIGATDAIVRARTSNGEIAFAGSMAPGPQSLETSNGAISLVLGPDATFNLDLETSNAEVKVGYPVTTSETASPARLVGRVGAAPATAISARTSNAGITITPAK